jgi:hypothetical protein
MMGPNSEGFVRQSPPTFCFLFGAVRTARCPCRVSRYRVASGAARCAVRFVRLVR